MDQFGELRTEGDHDRIDRCQTDDSGIKYLCQCKDTGVLTVGRIGRRAEQCRNGSTHTVTDQGPVQAGIFNEILSDC